MAILLKPSKLARVGRQLARTAMRKAEKRQNADYVRKEWAIRREEVYKRDKGRCRATGEMLALKHPDWSRVANCHHIKYRSAGGDDRPENLLTLSPAAHESEHLGLLHVAVPVSGEGANGTVQLTSTDENGNVLKVWESPCPSK